MFDSAWEAKLGNIHDVILFLSFVIALFAVMSRKVHHTQVNELLQYRQLRFVELEALSSACLTELHLKSNVAALFQFTSVPQRLTCRVKNATLVAASDRNTIRVCIMHSENVVRG